MMTKQDATAAYTAYAELEAAAEAFYAAAHKVAQLLPAEAQGLYALCDSVNTQIAHIDDELDEVL